MPPNELPDEHRDWPCDPFDLLGVERGADDIVIRTAYTRLIRRFKPEHHPEQFAKIRAAYEACRDRSAWYRIAPSEAVAESIEVRAEPEPETQPEATAPLPPLRRVAPEPDTINVLWAEAIGGNLADAYRGLLAESLRNGSANLSLRLYWLLAFDPMLDLERTRHEWLYDALMRSRLRGSPLELYRRELEADPQAALADPYTDLFDIPADVSQLFAVANLRLTAAGRTGRYSYMEVDLIRLKVRLGIDRGAEWLALIAGAIDWAVWSTPNPSMSYFVAELESLKHLELQNAYLIDRIDQARYWGNRTLAVPNPMMAKFIRLVGMLWASRGRLSRAEIEEGLGSIAGQPKAYLTIFDDRIDFLRSGFGQLALNLLAPHLPEAEPPHAADLLRGYVRRVIPSL